MADHNICFDGELTTDPCDYFAEYDSVNLWGITFNPANSEELAFIYNKLLPGGGTCCHKLMILTIKPIHLSMKLNFL